MPIPARPHVPESGAWTGTPAVPVPVEWQHTYVSLTGSNGEGEEIPLTGVVSGSWPAIVLQPGASGLDMPPFEIHSENSPNLEGSLYRGARAAARPVLLPVYVYGIDRRTLRAFKRKLAAALNPLNGYCVLTFTESDGIPRRLRCYYTGGMEGNESVESAGFRWVSYGIQLTAMDPWFYGDTTVAASWSFGAAQPFLGKPFLPLRLGKGSRAGGALTVTNPGDIQAWPVWTVTGPVNSLTLTGPDGGSWSLPARPGGADAVPSGRIVTVDCRPGYKTLTDDQETNYFPLLGSHPSLWPVPPGTSAIRADLVAGSGTATVTMTLHPRYESY